METIDRYLLTFLLNSLWQVSAAVTIAALASLLMRSAPARHRYAVCAAGLLAALLLPVVSIREWTRPAPSIGVPVAAPSFAAPPLRPLSVTRARAAVEPVESRRSVRFPQTAATLVLFAYAAFLAWRLAGLAWAAWRTASICRRATAHGPDRSLLWNRCLQAFGLTRVKLRWSAHVSGPVTAARTIILPLSMADAPDDEFTAAVGHEMAHIARGDFALNLLFELISLPISFQPAAAWLRREIGRMRELACDELVATRLLAPEVYAQSIVRIAAGLTRLTQPGYSLGVFDGDILEERIRRLLDRRAANLRRGRVLLAGAIGSLAACVIIASGLAISARAQGPARDEMRLAGDAYNSGYFAQAAEHFQKAVALDPGNVNARLFLAGTYVREFAAAGKFSPDESAPAPLIAAALQQYREVLRRDPRNVTAVFGIVSLNSVRDPKEARDLLMKVIADDPRNKEAYYTVAVLDWQSAYKAITAANHGAGPAMYQQIADPNLRAQVRAQYLPQIEEAFRMLQIALDIDPKWPDPMAFMNLVSRIKAPLMDDPAESAKLIAQADGWVHQAIANGGRRLRPTQTVEKIDVDEPAPRTVPLTIPAPPPPPPPPPPGYRGNGDK